FRPRAANRSGRPCRQRSTNRCGNSRSTRCSWNSSFQQSRWDQVMAAEPFFSQTNAQSYDAVPYPGLAVTRSQPDFLETVARLRGLAPAPAANARVLELGCAAGQNLIPLAERYPQATFVGVDISQRQIQDARTLASELSL